MYILSLVVVVGLVTAMVVDRYNPRTVEVALDEMSRTAAKR